MAMPTLIERLRQDEDPDVRAQSAQALGSIGVDAGGSALAEAVAALVHSLQDGSPEVRAAAARTLRPASPHLPAPSRGGQLARGGSSEMTTEALEAKLGLLGERLSGRRGNLRNRERTNRLLMLVQLELNGLADEKRYAGIIEGVLRARGGRADRRRAILDPTASSLRP